MPETRNMRRKIVSSLMQTLTIKVHFLFGDTCPNWAVRNVLILLNRNLSLASFLIGVVANPVYYQIRK